MLAYQLTSILQGGRGGHTISDSDITRSLKMLGGSYDKMEMKLAKLKSIDNFINASIDKGKLYDLIEESDNAGLYYAVKKVSNLMADYKTSDYTQKINQEHRANTGEAPATIRSSSVTELIKSAIRIPAVAESDNFKEGVYRQGIGQILSDGRGGTSPGQIMKDRFVVNAFALDLQKRALREFPDANNQKHVEKRAEINARVREMAPGVFDLISGEFKPYSLVIATHNGKEVIGFTDPSAVAPTATENVPGTPTPANPTGSLTGRSLSERRAPRKALTPEEEAAAGQEQETEAGRIADRRRAAQQRAIRSGSRLFGKGQ